MLRPVLLLLAFGLTRDGFAQPGTGYAPFEDSATPVPLTKVPARVGDQAPDFVVTDVLAGTTTPVSAFHGRVVYLDFWATWCPTCPPVVDRANRLAADYRKNRENRVAVVGVNLDRDIETAREAVRANAWGRMQHLWSGPDLSGRENLASKAFGIIELPYAVLINTSGTVVWRGNPALHPPEGKIQALLDGGKNR